LIYLKSEEKKSSSVIKKHMNMLSATHKLLYSHQPDFRPLTEATLLVLMKKGINNAERKLPVVKPWFSLSKLFAHLAGVAANPKTCPIEELRSKAIMLLRLDSFCRAADLASVDWPEIGADNLVIYFYDTKTARSSQQMTIRAYREWQICSVATVRAYCDRIKTLPCQLRNRNVNGVMKECRPLFVSLTKEAVIVEGKEVKMHTPLGSERIAKITKDRLRAAGITGDDHKGHSVRGAAASKAYNLGTPIAEVLARGRWKEQFTFLTTYHRPVRYRGRTDNLRGWPIEDLLRHQIQRA